MNAIKAFVTVLEYGNHSINVCHHHYIVITIIFAIVIMIALSNIYLDPIAYQVLYQVQRILEIEKYDPLTGSWACRHPQVLQQTLVQGKGHREEIDEDFQGEQCLN